METVMDRIPIVHNRIRTLLTLILTAGLLTCMLAGCSASGAEKKVTEDLESMRYVELDKNTEEEINSMLSDQGREYFELFLSKAGEFEYEILDSKEDTSGQAGDSAIVTVRIRTYDFASEYLKTWTEYLEKSDPEQFDEAALYEDLFRNLSSLSKKDYIADAIIKCEPEDDGSWKTDAKTNRVLRDAILGGMLNEIAGLAGAGE